MSRLEQDIEVRKLDKSVYDLSKKYKILKNSEIAASLVTVAAFMSAGYEERQQDISAYPFLVVGLLTLVGVVSSLEHLRGNTRHDLIREEDRLTRAKRKQEYILAYETPQEKPVSTFTTNFSETFEPLDIRGKLDPISSSGGYYNGPFVKESYQEVVIKKD